MNQLFKQLIPIDILTHFLNEVCDIIDNSFVLTNESYKRSILNNSLSKFIMDIIPYYHSSKQYYASRKMTFSRLSTIIRQICKSHNLSFTSKITYRNSTYQIHHYIDISIDSNLSSS